MTDVIVMVPIQRATLALLVRSAAALADTYVLLSEHGQLDPSVDDIMAIRAAVELGRRAVEAGGGGERFQRGSATGALWRTNHEDRIGGF